MKRVFALILAVVMLLLTGCQQGIEEPETDQNMPAGSEITGTPDEDEPALNPLTGDNNLAEDRAGKLPVAIPVNFILYSLPVYGVSKAEVTYEMLCEGNMSLTRLLCLYSDVRDIPQIGSVRNSYEHFLQLAAPFDFVLTGFAGSEINPHADLYGIQAINAFEYESLIVTDKERAETYPSEHTKFITPQSLKTAYQEAGIDENAEDAQSPIFNFTAAGDSAIILNGGEAKEILYKFYKDHSYIWENQEIEVFNSTSGFQYNGISGLYEKQINGKALTDAAFEDCAVGYDNVLLLYGEEQQYRNPDQYEPVEGNEQYLLTYDFEQGGEGYYFTRGRYEKIQWSKADNARLIIRRENGEEIALNTGKTYVAVINEERLPYLEIS